MVRDVFLRLSAQNFLLDWMGDVKEREVKDHSEVSGRITGDESLPTEIGKAPTEVE